MNIHTELSAKELDLLGGVPTIRVSVLHLKLADLLCVLNSIELLSCVEGWLLAVVMAIGFGATVFNFEMLTA